MVLPCYYIHSIRLSDSLYPQRDVTTLCLIINIASATVGDLQALLAVHLLLLSSLLDVNSTWQQRERDKNGNQFTRLNVSHAHSWIMFRVESKGPTLLVFFFCMTSCSQFSSTSDIGKPPSIQSLPSPNKIFFVLPEKKKLCNFRLVASSLRLVAFTCRPVNPSVLVPF
jgi:hypothetical protein